MHFIICFHQMLTAPFLCCAIQPEPWTPLLNKMGKVSIKSRLSLSSAHEIQGPGMKLVFTTTFANIPEKTLLRNSQQLYHLARKKKVYNGNNPLNLSEQKLSKIHNIANIKVGYVKISFSKLLQKFENDTKSYFTYKWKQIVDIWLTWIVTISSIRSHAYMKI